MRLVRYLYRYGYGEQDIRRLFSFIDAVVSLPFDQDRQFVQAVEDFKEEREMAYVTSIERVKLWESKEQGKEEGIALGIEQGIEKGIVQGQAMGMSAMLGALLERRFGVLPADARTRLAKASPAELQRWSLRILDAESLSAVWR